jgi:hypothetical protein
VAAGDLLNLQIRWHELVETRIKAHDIDDMETVLFTLEMAGGCSDRSIIKTPKKNRTLRIAILRRCF